MRKAVVGACLFLASLCAFAQSNPVPFVNQPVVPMTAAPGGPGFTLTVNGAGFVSGSVVNWNGAALTTTFVSTTQLTATVPGAKIASAGTASVTVANPAPGGGASNVQFFAISNLIPTVSFTGTYGVTVQDPTGIVADFNGDGKQDLAYVQTVSGVNQIAVELGNGDGSFQPPQAVPAGEPEVWVVGDFNGDGKLDLAIIQGGDGPNLGVLLGNGDGTFQSPIWTSWPGANSGSMTTDGMRRPVSGRDAEYAPKLSTCSEAQEIKGDRQ
jgi:hypothetical protein